MSPFDLVNGLFEMFGMFFILPSIVKLYKDKEVKGVSWIHACFFAAWGLWNLVYYPSLQQWLSFAGGIGIAIANIVWLSQLIYYTRRDANARQ